jgi:excisionase family DNA binding protein
MGALAKDETLQDETYLPREDTAEIIDVLKAGLAVTVAPHHLTLSTQEVADLLRISRTTLVRLLETGAIPFEKPSRHRKVRLDDLLEYHRRQRNQA